MTIKFNDREITLKYTFRSDMLFEDAVGHTFAAKNTQEWLQYMFCTIVALTKDETLKFDNFLDWIVETPEYNAAFYDFIDWWGNYQKCVMNLRKKAETEQTEQPEQSKKKVSRSRKK